MLNDGIEKKGSLWKLIEQFDLGTGSSFGGFGEDRLYNWYHLLGGL